MWRLTLSKFLGLAIGLVAAAYALSYIPGASLYLAVGLVLWFVFEGVLIGLMGFVTQHPLWKSFKLPAWFRGLWIGMFMHLTLFLLLHDMVDWVAVVPEWIEFDWLRDPLVLVMIEGAILGLLWDSLITAATGEGKSLAKSL